MLNRDERQQPASSVSLADAKVRFISGSCLRRLVESLHKRALQCHWLAFFPDPGRPSFLLALLLREPNSRVRANLLDLLASLFQGSKAFLLLAEDFGVPKTAFTPLSTRLAGSLREMHRQILQALLAERSQATQAQLLRCVGQLAGNVPYQKLRPGLVTKIFKVASPFLLSESPDVKSAALQCFGQLASLEGPAFEVSHCLLQDCLRSPAASPMLTGFHTPLLGPQTAPFESSWLVQHCLRVAHPRGDGWQNDDTPSGSAAAAAGQSQQQAALEPTAVRVEALATLRWLVLRYWNFVSPVSEQLRLTLQLCLLPESNRAVRAASVRALDALLTSLPPAEAAAPVWSAFLPALLSCLQPAAHYSVRSAAAECLALLDDASSANLPSELLGDAFQALLALCQDGLNTVRAAAVRALGAWTALSPIRFENNGRRLLALVWRFADLCAGIESLVVRAQAAWSLAQASEALLALSEQSRYPPSPPLLSEADLVRLFLAGMNLCADAPKVRENAARLLGNLFCLAALCSDYLESAASGSGGRGHLRACMEQAATGLANLVTPGGADSASARVRWNASLAIRCAFGRLPVGEPWTLCLHSALLGALQTDKYFKVKIHAACALLTLQERRQFGDLAAASEQQPSNPMARLIGSVIGCARHVRSMDIPFSEQTHKTVLDYLLCLLLLRACSLLSPGDADAVSPLLSDVANDASGEIGPIDLLASQLSRLWTAQAALVWDSGAQVRQAFFLGRGGGSSASLSTSTTSTGAAASLLEPDFAVEALDAAEANLTAAAGAAAGIGGGGDCCQRLLELLAGARAEQALHATSLASAFRQTYD
ncbi:hypothetical protein BOX15_Mlig027180g1 [Macrostomum lignano]|uniref:HEAT repeat-containing protein 6 n=1 Tax=Macrostomum lignano TaxID=282301 RepID=A0A267H6W8_9PLAT|nr:hypothetical protein BOX15_Mlig027180g1 [Macrostomum lignano]